MDWSIVLGLLKYLFMGIFIIFFVMDILSKKSYKIHYYISITIAVFFTVLRWQWATGYKVGFIALFVLLTVKTIVDERKRWMDNNRCKIKT